MTNEFLKQPLARGFTLLETLIAVTIVTLAVAGPLMAASRALILAQVSRDQLTASYLAQEAVEYVRAMRDDAFLQSYRTGGTDVSGVAWTDFISGSSVRSITNCIATACTLDPTLPMGFGSGASLKTASGNAPLYISNGIYTQQAVGTQTPFSRIVRAMVISSTEAAITSTVSWSFHGIPYQVVITTHLTAWQ